MNNKVDIKNMEVKKGTYYTVAEMADMLNLPIETVKTRLKNKGVKPLSRDALYAASDFGIIKDVTMGRPKTAPESKQTKNGKASAKPTTSKKQGSKKK